jgi:hypothetical protein
MYPHNGAHLIFMSLLLCVGNLSPALGGRNQVGIGLSHVASNKRHLLSIVRNSPLQAGELNRTVPAFWSLENE